MTYEAGMAVPVLATVTTGVAADVTVMEGVINSATEVQVGALVRVGEGWRVRVGVQVGGWRMMVAVGVGVW